MDNILDALISGKAMRIQNNKASMILKCLDFVKYNFIKPYYRRLIHSIYICFFLFYLFFTRGSTDSAIPEKFKSFENVFLDLESSVILSEVLQ